MGMVWAGCSLIVDADKYEWRADGGTDGALTDGALTDSGDAGDADTGSEGPRPLDATADASRHGVCCGCGDTGCVGGLPCRAVTPHGCHARTDCVWLCVGCGLLECSPEGR